MVWLCDICGSSFTLRELIDNFYEMAFKSRFNDTNKLVRVRTNSMSMRREIAAAAQVLVLYRVAVVCTSTTGFASSAPTSALVLRLVLHFAAGSFRYGWMMDGGDVG